VLVTVLVAFAVYAMLPDPLVRLPSWLVTVVGVLALLPLVLYNPTRLDRESAWSRRLSILFAVGFVVVSQVHIVAIVVQLVDGSADGPTTLLVAFAVWLTNVVAFGLVFWELDRGGPVARRVEGIRDDAGQDFRFPQQDGSPGMDPAWQPVFFDYLFFSLSSMMAFSPTDVMPLTLRAKALMAFESLTGFVLLALVISRGVNILG